MVHITKSAESLLQLVQSQSQPGVWDTFSTDFQFKVVKTDCILRWKVLKNPASSSDCTGTCWQSVKMTQTWRLWPFFLLHLSSGLSGAFFFCLPQSSPKLSWTKVHPTFTWQPFWRKPHCNNFRKFPSILYSDNSLQTSNCLFVQFSYPDQTVQLFLPSIQLSNSVQLFRSVQYSSIISFQHSVVQFSSVQLSNSVQFSYSVQYSSVQLHFSYFLSSIQLFSLIQFSYSE